MGTLSERTRMPLSLVVTLVGFVVGFGGSAAVAQFRISDHSTRVERLESSSRDTELRLQRLEDHYQYIRESLKELKERR